ncbi:hypothetical protein FRC03_002133 [Tulasnella sp. 419]|nr:hypothetical protein FRC03_002133 [Tulasnella sp. 419]
MARLKSSKKSPRRIRSSCSQLNTKQSRKPLPPAHVVPQPPSRSSLLLQVEDQTPDDFDDPNYDWLCDKGQGTTSLDESSDDLSDVGDSDEGSRMSRRQGIEVVGSQHPPNQLAISQAQPDTTATTQPALSTSPNYSQPPQSLATPATIPMYSNRSNKSIYSVQCSIPNVSVPSSFLRLFRSKLIDANHQIDQLSFNL